MVFELKKRVFDNSLGKCFYCHKTLCFSNHGKYGRRGAWHIDHKLARSNGGGDVIENLIAACISCNLKKSDSSSRVFRYVAKPQRLKRRDYAIDRDITKVAVLLFALGAAGCVMVYQWLSNSDNNSTGSNEPKEETKNYALTALFIIALMVTVVVVIKKSHATT